MPIDIRFPRPNRIEFDYVGAITDREFLEAQARWHEILKKADVERRRITMLVDGARSEGMSAGQRRIAADFSKEQAALLKRVVAAQAVVLVSSIQRGVLTAIVWLNPPPAPLKAVSTREEGIAYLDEVERTESRRTA